MKLLKGKGTGSKRASKWITLIMSREHSITISHKREKCTKQKEGYIQPAQSPRLW